MTKLDTGICRRPPF